MFTEWLVEAHYVRILLQLPKIPHFMTLQKFANRKDQQCDARKTISSFVVLTGTRRRHIFVGIDSTGFNITH
jgi:hypothetical protein